MHPFQQLDLVKLMEAVEPADILAIAAGFAPETRSIGAAADRQRSLIEDLVTKEVGERCLGGGH